MLIRSDVINYYLSTVKGQTSYLEIGAKTGDNLARVFADKKDGVDINPNAVCEFKMPSDQFFEKNQNSYDVIFVDGDHTYSQAYKDVVNSLKVLKPGGVIVMHDCNPINEKCQGPYTEDGPWTGDVWKAFVRLRTERDDVKMFTIDTDWGLGVIETGKTQDKAYYNPEFYQYRVFSQFKKQALNMISVEEWFSLIKKK